MRDFVKTMDFVAKFNALADDVNKCVFADQSTNRSLIEQGYMLYGDDAFNRPPRTMGEWELEQFEQTTNELEKELKELFGELVELCPTMADMPQYFSVWTNILKRMVRHNVEWWTEHESLSFWENQGVMERAQFDCALAVSSLHSLNDAVQRMIADVLEIYAINAPQSTITAEVEQLPAKKKSIDEETYKKALASPIMKALFKQKEEKLKDFLNYCVYAKNGSDIARYACKIKSDTNISSKDGVELYAELVKLEIVKIKESTWHSAFYDGYSQKK